MQTLWTRVAQVRGSCRCPQCISAANGVARRATANATRRMPRYLTSSTLWYSGIFAAAATFDAGVKKGRREQWDRAIADVKQELEQPAHALGEQQTPVRQVAEAKLPSDESSFKPFGTLPEDEDAFSYIDAQRASPLWPTNTGPALRRDHLPPESIYATNGRKRRLDVTPLSTQKLATIQVSVEMLLFEFFLELERRGWSSEAAKAVPAEFAKNILQDQSELMSRFDSKARTFEGRRRLDNTLHGYQPTEDNNDSLCRFSQYKLEYANRSVRGLNFSLLELFKLQARYSISKPELLAKLAYNLSVCSGPPNLKTFNTLLLGFSAMEEPTLVDKTINAIRQAHMRPNEVTLAAVLKHYTKTDQPEVFINWVELMRGKHGGLALARSDITISKGGQARLMRKPKHPDKILQLPYATPFVFGPLIAGVIKFAGFETALKICQNMGMEGWGLCMSGLTPLLQDCAERADWTSGLAVWNQIQALKGISRRKLGSKWVTERIKLHTFAAMLRLCSKCDKKEYFDYVFDKALSVHHDSGGRLVQLVKEEVEPQLGTDISLDKGHAVDSQDDSMMRNMAASGVSPDVEVPNEDNPVQYQRQAQAASQVSSELRLILDESVEQSNEVQQDVEFTPFERRQQDTGLIKSSRPTSLPQKSELLEEQLWGLLPPSDEIHDYELQERPMAIPGRAE